LINCLKFFVAVALPVTTNSPVQVKGFRVSSSSNVLIGVVEDTEIHDIKKFLVLIYTGLNH
jgi:hypothetical protein